MKKIILTFSLWMTCSLSLMGQTDTLGNQWYKNLLATNPNRSFIKLMTWREGVYHVDIADLAQSITGFDMSAVDAKTMQLYYRGKRIPMHVSPENSSTFDFFEFVGRQNDGWVDSLMYFDPVSGMPSSQDLRPVKQVSLYTDSAAFFLTWESAGGTLGTRYSPPYYNNVYSPTLPTINKFSFNAPYIPGTQVYSSKSDNLTPKTYSPGGGNTYNLNHVLNSDYTTGEGWVGPAYGNTDGTANPYTLNLKTRYQVPNTPVVFTTRVFGKSEKPHWLKLTFNGTMIIDSILSTNPDVIIGDFSKTLTVNIPDSVNVKYDTPNYTDNNNICWANVLYERDPAKGMDSWVRWSIPKISPPLGQQSLLTIPNVRGGQFSYAFDETNKQIIVGKLDFGTPTNRTMRMIFPGTNTGRLIVTTDSGMLKPAVYKSSLNQLHAAGTNGAKMIVLTHKAFSDAAVKYKAYRDTTTVNPLPTQIVYVDEIYDEYGYGSETPWAIKRFCHEALTKWPTKPEFFFILGKAVHTSGNRNTVLSACEPVSDHEFVSHFNPGASVASLDLTLRAAIGRVCVATNDEALVYLDKIKTHEQTPWEPWKKRGIFLGGGKTVDEVSKIESTMIYDKNIFEGYPFGGDAYRYQKKSNDPLDPSASYHQNISDGVSWIHFFGHSASLLVDVSLKTPDLYSNYGKFPVMLAMGCYVGRFNQEASLGQKWVGQANRGAIAYIGNSGPGFPDQLSNYSRIGHNYIWRYMLGERLGEVMTSYHNKFIDSLGASSNQNRNHIRQLNLQGDPSIKINVPQGIDLEVNNSNVYFTPDNFTALSDSFKINIIVRNLGLVSKDSFTVSVRQLLPSNTWFSHPSKRMQLLTYQDTLSFYLKNPIGKDMAGLNSFEIYVDSANAISEYNENNNFVSLSKLVAGNIPACLFPIEFAIIDQSKPTLVASGYSMTRDSLVNYIIEMDTTYDFSSQFIQISPLIVGKSMLAKWEIPVSLPDSTVCYWRARLADVQPATWAYSSFRYIKNKVGWEQARMPQFSKDTKSQITNDILQNQWTFGNIFKKFQFTVPANGGGFSVSINEAVYSGAGYVASSYNCVPFMIVDGKTLENKTSSLGFGNTVDYALVPTPSSTGNLQHLLNALQGANDGDYFYITSNNNPYVALWPSYVFDMLESYGVSPNLRFLANGKSFLIFGRKGSPSSVKTLFNPTIGSTTTISLDEVLALPLTNATVKSTIIGPSKGWDRLIWNWNTIDPQVKESLDVSVFGVKADGSEQYMFTTSGAGTYMLDTISHAMYPSLYMKAEFKDLIYATAPQLQHWHVLYDQAPDAVVYPFVNYLFESDTISEGGNIAVRISAVNPSKIDMDSLLVNFKIERADRTLALSVNKRFAPLPHEGNIPILFNLTSGNLNLEGNVKFIVQLNPDNDQYEQYFFNNTYEQNFFVLRDRQNPLMQVTFDGKEIMDMDIVSPTPEIFVQLKDENKYLAADDTTSFELLFKSPNSQTPERISLSDARVKWEPATLPQNRAKLYFYPGKIKPLNDTGDDHYSLIVQASDKRGNPAGIDNGSNNYNSYPGNGNYEIGFRVINAHTISNVLNYPNPFSTSTRFAYILTGNELPEVFKVEIYTISGKQIKSIDLVELGDVHFGKNVTEYAWDGTDEFGNRLANGVYLYRVQMRMKSNTLESSKEDDKTDKYFKSGWGKMYIMR